MARSYNLIRYLYMPLSEQREMEVSKLDWFHGKLQEDWKRENPVIEE